MRSRILVAALAMVFVAGSALVAVSQEAESQLQLVAEVHVKPGLVADFEAAHNDRNERKTQAGVSFLTRASISESLVYRFTTPVGDWAGVDKRASEMGELAPAAPGMQQAVEAAIDHVDTYIRRTRPQLNYVPANPRLQPAEWGFVHRVELYVRQGMMDEVAGVIQQAAALYEQHDSGETFFVTSQVRGADGPMMEIALLAADAADFYTHAAETDAQMGEALQELRAQVGALCRRIEISNYIFRRDLGYQPPG